MVDSAEEVTVRKLRTVADGIMITLQDGQELKTH
jgi:hypothetical protein